MNKKGQGLENKTPWVKIGVLVAIILIVGGAYLAYKYLGSSEENQEYSFLDSCLNSCGSCEQNCYDMDYLEKSRSESDESLCDKISSESLKNECVNSFILTRAIEGGDASICESIADEIEKGICINIVESSLNPPATEE